MGGITKKVTPTQNGGNILHQYARDAGVGRSRVRILWLACAALGLLLVPVVPLQAAGTGNSQQAAGIDNRWVPWIGSWKLVSSITGTDGKEAVGDFQLDVRPDAQRTAVIMRASQDKTVLYEDTIAANGLSQPLKDKECSGWYQYSWSDTGKRLLFESESSCPGVSTRKISGLSVIDRKGEWIDIQLMQDQEDRIITIRRYESLADKTQGAAGPGRVTTRTARVAASANFSVNEIIELSKKVPQEILEAAVLEIHEPFNISAKILARLADAGVPNPVIDLMVALSFPDKFYIERDTVSLVAENNSGAQGSGVAYAYPPYVYYSSMDPFFPWYWTPSTYALYWNAGWDVWPGVYYPYYSGPYYSGAGSPGWRERRNSGRLVAGRGYTRVSSRDSGFTGSGSANPRPSSERSSPRTGSYSRSNSSPAPSSGSVRYGSSSGRVVAAPSSGSGSVAPSSGGSSGGSSGYSGGSSPSVSPRGYSSGGSSSGSAHRRSQE